MSKQVHDMFDDIAHRYDLTNDVLCAGIHRLWRKVLLRHANVRPGLQVLDLCTGTGEVARACAHLVGPTGKVTAVDFVKSMLDLAKKKPPIAPSDAPIEYIQSDAAHLPFEANSFDVAVIAYGIRNVDNPLQALEEFHRVLRPGSRLAVLEFGQPTNPLLGSLFRFYSRYLMPTIGSVLTGNRSAYEYLPATSAAFPAGDRFLELLAKAGFLTPRQQPLMSGIAYVYWADKAAEQR